MLASKQCTIWKADCQPQTDTGGCRISAVGDDHGAQRQRHVHAAGEGDVADAAAVGPPLHRLQLVDDLHRPHLQTATALVAPNTWRPIEHAGILGIRASTFVTHASGVPAGHFA
jgi:hypothetical protein